MDCAGIEGCTKGICVENHTTCIEAARLILDPFGLPLFPDNRIALSGMIPMLSKLPDASLDYVVSGGL
jgi:hypothetical protein